MNIKNLSPGQLLYNTYTAETATVLHLRYYRGGKRIAGVCVVEHKYRPTEIELGVTCFTQGPWRAITPELITHT